MLTLEQVIEAVKNGRKSECFDGRDFLRLLSFVPVELWEIFNHEPTSTIQPLVWTEENILKQLERDVAFGFEKALNRRSLSSGLMYEVVKMWMWILEDDLQNHDSYAMYGLPLFKAVAIKYGFSNEIGENEGSESYYDQEFYHE